MNDIKFGKKVALLGALVLFLAAVVEILAPPATLINLIFEILGGLALVAYVLVGNDNLQ